MVGSIAFTKSCIVSPSGSVINTCTFGPVCVHPDYRRRGILRQLLTHSLGVAKAMGYPAAIIFGHPDIYGKLGFRCAERFDVTSESGNWCSALMLYVLDGATMEAVLAGGGGRFVESSVFATIDFAQMDEFEASFQAEHHLEKAETESQMRFRVVSELKYKGLPLAI